MDITIFESVTTEQSLIELESESEKYDGLYVEMGDAEQRKYVKDKAAVITALIKGGEDKRKAINKANQTNTNNVWTLIESRLRKANEPFTLLIDEHNAKRAKILSDEKAERERKELIIQIIDDHEFAMLMNKEFNENTEQREKENQEAINQAAESKIAHAKATEAAGKIKRESDIENRRKVNLQALADLIEFGVEGSQARRAISAIASKQVSNMAINY